MVTVYDVADAVGLSIASVSRALNGRSGVSPETAERIRRVAHEMGYQPNDVARSLVAKSTQTIGLLVPDITNPFFPELVKGVQDVVEREGHVLVLSNSADQAEKVSRDLAVLRRKQIDGLIVVAGTLGGDVDAAAFEGLPTVFLDRRPSMPDALSVGVDHEAAGYDAVRHLTRLGHTRIAHISGPDGLLVAAERRAGWERACREAGIPADEMLVAPGEFLESGGYDAAAALFGRGADFTAVFAANDLSAIGFLAYCTQHGIDVPGRVSLVGMDGIQLARYTTPVLTTVAQPIQDLGLRAGMLLFEAMRGERPANGRVLLPTRLAEGGSTRAIGVAG